MPPMLDIDQVVYRWPGSSHFFGPVSATLAPGRWVALIGPNGSGKSTLLKLVAALWKPDSGTIRSEGRAIASLSASERAQQLAFVPQSLDTSFDLTVKEVVELGRLNQLSWTERLRFKAAPDRTEVTDIMEQTGVMELSARSFTSLSGGEARRVLLAAALVQHAPLLLLDEPTAHLDPGHAMRFLDLVKARVSQGDLTVLMAYHDLTTVGLYADEIWVLDEGQLLLTGTPADVLFHPFIRKVYDVDLVPLSHPRTHRPMLIFP